MSEEVIEQSQESNVPVAEAPVPEAAAAPEEEKVTEVTKSVEATEEPAYTPNFKYKAAGKEKELEEWIRAAIKDQETEKKARELYEKVDGFDMVKSRTENLEKQFQEVAQSRQQIIEDVQRAFTYRDKGDFESFFQEVGIPIEKVAQWLVEKANRMNLPPEERKVYDERDAYLRKEIELERKAQGLEQRMEQLASQARQQELNVTLQNPEYASYQSAYDAAVGKPGAFKEAVRRHGIAEFKTSGRDLTPEEAIQGVMNMLGPAYKTPSQAVEAPVIAKQMPVIPRVSGKAMSATSKKPTSIDDLKKISAQLQG